MKVVVLGSGVIGVSTAYQLALAGHEVTVVDRQPAAALETSFANAGEVSPGYSAPWAGPGVPLKAIRWLLMRHRPLVIRPQFDLAMVRWIAAMLGNCTAARYELNKGRMVRLAEYSRDCLVRLRAETGIGYDERALGTLQLFRTQQQLDGAGADIAVLQRLGVPFQLLDRAGCTAHEPGLAATRSDSRPDARESVDAGPKFVGGLRLPGDETGDCFKFTQGLAQLAAERGVQFRWGTTIRRLQTLRHGAFDAVVTNAGTLKADACVVALGSHSPMLVRPLGLRLPIYPVKGYSITLPVTDPPGAPRSTVLDETYKIAVTRLGDRIRAGGTAELAGYSLKLHDARRQTLEHVVDDLFPRGGDTTRSTFWCGLRPMTPDGTPIVGATPFPGLFLATGHGTLGWTMAAGTGRLVADIVSGRTPEIDLEGLGIERYART